MWLNPALPSLRVVAAALMLAAPSAVYAQALVYPGQPQPGMAIESTDIKGRELRPVVPAITGPAAASSEEQAGIQYAILQGTNKVTARTTRLEMPIGTLVRFGNLEVVVQKCETTQPPARREQGALLDVWELKPSERPAQIFYGWMFASSPSISALQHPVYDLTLLECLRKKSLDESEPAGDVKEKDAQ
jgi:hypothetical protein